MASRIAVNGFGRMGRLVTRALLDRGDLPGLNLVAVNEIAGGPETAAHLLEFDSVHGRWTGHRVSAGNGALHIDDTRIRFSEAAAPDATGWSGETVDIVLECSGKFRTPESLQAYFAAGIKKVIVAAPVKDDRALNVVMGINDDLYEPDRHHLLTAASCTTNCLAPVVRVIHDNLRIVHGAITTIHDVTNTQVMVDAPHKDLRRARSGLNSLIPTTTGSATAIALIYPELKGKLNGHAVRVPLLNASLTDCVFEVSRDTTVEEVNGLFKAAADGFLKGILAYEERPLVSADFVNDLHSSIIDAPSTMVVDGRQVKVYAWYDNEWGYVHRMAELAAKVAASL
ncbi:MAG: ArsJ-associated glyceraldehyde-3-phosphate dehydrogenase [Alphaproteobacteria bacterium]|nr:ArsJ-associated glyceraldehyde-3-phosphate dehydrogenase [Alphaproteobacteria bacterium]